MGAEGWPWETRVGSPCWMDARRGQQLSPWCSGIRRVLILPCSRRGITGLNTPLSQSPGAGWSLLERGKCHKEQFPPILLTGGCTNELLKNSGVGEGGGKKPGLTPGVGAGAAFNWQLLQALQPSPPCC